MKYLDLLDVHLKDDILCDLFETYDVDVVYEYDRMHENLPDEYRAEISDLGLEFVFDEKQMLNTLFMEQKEIETFNPFEDDENLKRFESKASAIKYATENEIEITEGISNFMGEEKDWIRFDFPKHMIHYEFVFRKLKKITIQKLKA